MAPDFAVVMSSLPLGLSDGRPVSSRGSVTSLSHSRTRAFDPA